MDDKCLLALYDVLSPEARNIFDVLRRTPDDPISMDNLMLRAQVSTQQTRKGVWGLANTGLIRYAYRKPVQLSQSGIRLTELLQKELP